MYTCLNLRDSVDRGPIPDCILGNVWQLCVLLGRNTKEIGVTLERVLLCFDFADMRGSHCGTRRLRDCGSSAGGT